MSPAPVISYDRTYRTKDVTVHAARVTLANVRDIAVWIAEHGGSVAGMTYHANGPVETRGIRIGTIDGDQILFGVGDYVVRDSFGDFFRADSDEFHRVFDRVLSTEDIEKAGLQTWASGKASADA